LLAKKPRITKEVACSKKENKQVHGESRVCNAHFELGENNGADDVLVLRKRKQNLLLKKAM